MSLPPRFSIVTPSFRNSDWLKLCIASVTDQGMTLEHIVQDAGSDDGTLDWLTVDSRVRAFVERDSGMYDAMNRGLRRAQGEILACLNCDEQYLPGTLKAVSDFFERHPDVEMVFGDFVVVGRQIHLSSQGPDAAQKPSVGVPPPDLYLRHLFPAKHHSRARTFF